MPRYRIVTPNDIKLLLASSGLVNWAWPPDCSAQGFGNWLFARMSPLTLDTQRLAGLIEDYFAEGDHEADADRAARIGALVDQANSELEAIAAAVADIRSRGEGESIMKTLATIATSNDCAQVLTGLECDQRVTVVEAIERLTEVVTIFAQRGHQSYVPGVNLIEDVLIFGHVLELDVHLRRSLPVDGIDSSVCVEVLALARMTSDSGVRALITHAQMERRIDELASQKSSQERGVRQRVSL